MGKKGEKKVRKRGKKERKGRKHENIKINTLYEVKDSKIARKKKFCPRCGDGVFLAQHKGRLFCGRCSYTEFEKKDDKKN